ncbi:lipase family protein [Nocardia sp. NPDC051570]|uniref:lipase family protein n=1 Tax=Nocardia sp. NPDC051570 TaxID=3364324 RepID=UPI0037BBBC20
MLSIAAELQRGWAVSLSDYEGMHGHLAAAEEPGYMTLDGIRAAEQFAPLGLGKSTKVALWGYSGGGLATGWAAEMYSGYAPELNVVGTAMGGPPSDVRALLASNGTASAGLIGLGLSSLANAYPDFGAALSAHLTPEGAAEMQKIRSQCGFRNFAEQTFTDYNKYLNIPISQFIELPPVKTTFDATTLGANAPAMPLYVYQAVFDEMVPVATTDRMVEQYCAAGTSVTYKRDHASEHGSLALTGMYDAIDWLAQRLDTDMPKPAGCSTQNVLTTAAEPGVPQSMLDAAKAAIDLGLGLPIGPN